MPGGPAPTSSTAAASSTSSGPSSRPDLEPPGRQDGVNPAPGSGRDRLGADGRCRRRDRRRRDRPRLAFARLCARPCKDAAPEGAGERPLAQALGGESFSNHRRGAWKVRGGRHDARDSVGRPNVGLEPSCASTYEDGRRAKARRGTAVARSPEDRPRLRLSESGRMLRQQLAGRHDHAFLVAGTREPRRLPYGDATSASAFASRSGPSALTVTSERGRARQPGLENPSHSPRYGIDSRPRPQHRPRPGSPRRLAG